MIAVPVATSAFGRNGVTDGLWTFVTLHFPFPRSTFSGSLMRAVDPGAPAGHKRIGFRSSVKADVAIVAAISTENNEVANRVMRIPRRTCGLPVCLLFFRG